jgi:hypothetical protein
MSRVCDIAPVKPAARAKGTVKPSDMPMTMSRTVSLAVKCSSVCGFMLGYLVGDKHTVKAAFFWQLHS